MILAKILIFFRLISVIFFTETYLLAYQLDIWPDLKLLQLKFSDADSSAVTTIEQQKRDAENLIDEAVDSGDRAALEKAYEDLFSSTKALYFIYDRNFRSLRENLPAELPEDIERADEFERQSRANMNKSEIVREQASKTEGVTDSRRIYMIALDLEQMALLMKGRALRILQDYPFVYEYRWDRDFAITDGTPLRMVREITLTEEKRDLRVQEETDLADAEGISYIIQIAAHSEEISQSELNAIYSGSLKIDMIYEDNWYKYYFGPYRTFEEAEKVMKSLNLRNAFIAAYLNGRRIAVNEARKRQAE